MIPLRHELLHCHSRCRNDLGNGRHFCKRREFFSCARMRGGAGRTRTNNQTVKECGGVDQLTLSDTRHSSSRGPLLIGISTIGKSSVAVTPAWKVPVFAGPPQPSSPRTAPPVGAYDSIGLPLLLRQPPTDLTVVRLLSIPGVRQGELVGHPHIP